MFIGIQEFWEEDIVELSTLMNWPIQGFVSTNFNLNPDYYNEVSSLIKNKELMKRIIFLNEIDMELYSEALALRASRRKENLYYQHWFLIQNYQFNS